MHWKGLLPLTLCGALAACALPNYQWVPPGANGASLDGGFDSAAWTLPNGRVDYRPRARVLGRLRLNQETGGGGGGRPGPAEGFLHVYLDELGDSGACPSAEHNAHEFEAVTPVQIPLTSYEIPSVPVARYCLSLWIDVRPYAPDGGAEAGVDAGLDASDDADPGPSVSCDDYLSDPVMLEVTAPSTTAPEVPLNEEPRCP